MIYFCCKEDFEWYGDKAQSICIAYELKAVDGQLRCDMKETAELKYFSLDEEVTLFCKQHEEYLHMPSDMQDAELDMKENIVCIIKVKEKN